MRTYMIYLRTTADFTVAEEAKALGVSKQYIYDVEKGKKDGSMQFWLKFAKLHFIKSTSALSLAYKNE